VSFNLKQIFTFLVTAVNYRSV